DDTIVVFMTDNGGTAGVDVFNAGLRGRKTLLYEGGHRVPCWLRWPAGKLGPPRDEPAPAPNTDLLPALRELCQGKRGGKDGPGDELYRGVSLAPVLRGQAKAPADRKFMVQYGQVPKKHEACVVWGRWRLVHGKELFDVNADLAQKTDVAE